MQKHKFKPITDPNICAQCGSNEGIEMHHPIPRSKGGTFVIPLCYKCHGIAHDYKRRNISELSKEGLRKAKARGVKLGNPNWKIALAAGAKVRTSKADAFAERMGPVLDEIRSNTHVRTYAELADCLNRLGYKTRRGSMFHPSTTRALEKRWEKIKEQQ
jgi:hypothetical protein